MIRAGSARVLSGCAYSGTTGQCLALSQFCLPRRRAGPPSLQGVQVRQNAFSDNFGDSEGAVEPPASRNNGYPGAVSMLRSNSILQASASPSIGVVSTQSQLSSIQKELNRQRFSGSRPAASQQQLLPTSALEWKAFGRAKSVLRTNLPQGRCAGPEHAPVLVS